ncbi:transcriptional regulator, AbrB family [Ammonifex degensii KC4]|uniref:Transcriptional regulator, AbrB family n=1 Tax=Ammonifex degensii (strain DSM 10501 / KC4) TaxID=429009 RepID=C9RBL0_AMMDK|nr:AbrB/MazE/SpoVT family DNA-binding domain-containing protein [Ammonifex degensii]ACX51637.1 transcriptional regulator, AbrB family [Ammonifex degensii KC4]
MKVFVSMREIDELGRVTLPAELRRSLGWGPGTPLELFIDEAKGEIVLRLYEPGCLFCGRVDNVFEFRGKKVCRDCFAELEKLL